MNKNVISLNETTGIVTNGDVKIVTFDGDSSEMNKILRKENRLENEKSRKKELAKYKKHVINNIRKKNNLLVTFTFLSGIQLAAARVVETINPYLWITLVISGVIVTPFLWIAKTIEYGDYYNLARIRDQIFPKKEKESNTRIKKLEQEITDMKNDINYTETNLETSHEYVFNIPSREYEIGGYYNTPVTDAKVFKLVQERNLPSQNNSSKRR